MHQVLSLEEPRTYTGRELRSLWIYETFGTAGDALAAFIGPCDVTTEALVDAEDRRQGATIRAASMLHFIIEHFDDPLRAAVLRQRLFITMISDTLRDHVPDRAVRRDGDDLYVGPAKLSVSIATKSPVSTLIHVGLNIDPKGAPVEACGLGEWNVSVKDLAAVLADLYVREMDAVQFATTKVRGVP
ncbi:MAG: DUF366 family protein [Armatimonadota bacterium]